jgi:prepilin-type N-terminal cleavage/methylation domain-containing protein
MSRGLTLIEVMAGLAILGTLLASLVVARGRYVHQWALATRKEEAVQAADRLLAAWWINPDKLPRNAAGDVPDGKLRWRTHVVESVAAEDLKVQIVRLELFETGNNAGQAVAYRTEQRPLAQVDLVMSPPAKVVEGHGNLMANDTAAPPTPEGAQSP